MDLFDFGFMDLCEVFVYDEDVFSVFWEWV